MKFVIREVTTETHQLDGSRSQGSKSLLVGYGCVLPAPNISFWGQKRCHDNTKARDLQ